MALGKQLTPTSSLHTFALWARRNGYSVGEMIGFTSVNPRAHTKRSWHYDSENGIGKAADINWPSGGAAERARLITALDKAQDLGLAVIFARDGTAGVTNTHRTHLHVDVGPFSHLGRRSFVPRGGPDTKTLGVQAAVNATQDGIWGQDTRWRTETVRLASRHHGGQFPWGIEHAQRVIGATADGAWGPLSEAAHDKAVKGIQRAVGARQDGVWGPDTERRFLDAEDLRWRR